MLAVVVPRFFEPGIRKTSVALSWIAETRYALFLRYGSVLAFGSQADAVVREASNFGLSCFFGCRPKAEFVDFQLEAIVQRCGRVRQTPAGRQDPINRRACCGV